MTGEILAELKLTNTFLRALTLLAFQSAEREDKRNAHNGMTGQAEIDPNTPELQRLYLAIGGIAANDNGGI